MLVKIIATFIATVAFAKLFNAPTKTLVPTGLVGTAGFAVYIFLIELWGCSSMLSNFAGTVVLSVLSEIFARVYKEPVTIFSIPGIIPLVPGLPLYQAMNYFVLDAYNVGLTKFMQAFLDAVAIAMGIMLISSLARAYRRGKEMARSIR